MTVYVDWLMHHGWVLRGHHVRNCHMFADSVDELLEFAERIGLKPRWLQGKRAIHFDLTESRRKAAVELGAVELTRKTWRKVYHMALKQGEEWRCE